MSVLSMSDANALSPARDEQAARSIIGHSPLVPVKNEGAPRLIVDPPLAAPLADGRVFIQYRAENMRLLPVFGAGALNVSPRLGHVHVTVDDAPWHFVDASGGTLVVVGLPPGPHSLLIQLADPAHKVVGSKKVAFVIPASEAALGASLAPADGDP